MGLDERWYDSAAKNVLDRTGSACALVCIVGGNFGSGFGLAAVDGMVDVGELARLLRRVADDFDRAAKAAGRSLQDVVEEGEALVSESEPKEG